MINHDLHEKIRISATQHSDNIAPNLFQLIGYRARVAQELLDGTKNNPDDLMELFRYCNEQIKKLLAI